MNPLPQDVVLLQKSNPQLLQLTLSILPKKLHSCDSRRAYQTTIADQLRCRSAAEEELPHLQLAFVMTSTDPPVACLEVSREVLREAEKRGRSLSSRRRSTIATLPVYIPTSNYPTIMLARHQQVHFVHQHPSCLYYHLHH
nr:hypothetical protein Iba_chr08eCG8290 [Ipomoea batatas]